MAVALCGFYLVVVPLRYTDPTGHRECERYCSDEIITAGIASAYAGPWDPVAQARRMQTAQQAAGVAIDFTPVIGDAKGLVEVFTGRDLATGERLGGWRWLGLLGLSEVRHLRHADELADVIHNVGKRTAGVSIESGTQVYRVWGKDPSNPDLIRQSGPWGPSWTTVDPSTVPDYRGYAGLPSGGGSGALNAGRFVSVGTLDDVTGVQTRSALSIDGQPGGLFELTVPNPQEQISLTGVYGVNPPY